MGVEIERKFRVVGRPWVGHLGSSIEQGYLAVDDGVAVRVRLRDGRGILTVKGPSHGARRAEFEWDVDPVEARELLALCGARRVVKTRHEVPVGRHVFEVDVFGGRHEGLVVAEVELSAEDEVFERPPWLGEEVTDDRRFVNAVLAGPDGDAWRD